MIQSILPSCISPKAYSIAAALVALPLGIHQASIKEKPQIPLATRALVAIPSALVAFLPHQSTKQRVMVLAASVLLGQLVLDGAARLARPLVQKRLESKLDKNVSNHFSTALAWASEETLISMIIPRIQNLSDDEIGLIIHNTSAMGGKERFFEALLSNVKDHSIWWYRLENAFMASMKSKDFKKASLIFSKAKKVNFKEENLPFIIETAYGARSELNDVFEHTLQEADSTSMDIWQALFKADKDGHLVSRCIEDMDSEDTDREMAQRLLLFSIDYNMVYVCLQIINKFPDSVNGMGWFNRTLLLQAHREGLEEAVAYIHVSQQLRGADAQPSYPEGAQDLAKEDIPEKVRNIPDFYRKMGDSPLDLGKLSPDEQYQVRVLCNLGFGKIENEMFTKD